MNTILVIVLQTDGSFSIIETEVNKSKAMTTDIGYWTNIYVSSVAYHRHCPLPKEVGRLLLTKLVFRLDIDFRNETVLA